MQCILLFFLLLGLPGIYSVHAQDVASLEATLAEKDRDYHLQQTRLTAAQEKVTQLKGEIQQGQDGLTTRRRRLERVQEQLQQKMQLFLTNPSVSLEPEQQAYATAKASVEESEQGLIQLGQKLVASQREVATIQVALDGLMSERRALRQSLVTARFEQLRQQIEREQEVIVQGEASCGDESISQCQRRALEQTRQRAAEQGSAVLVNAATEVQDFQVTRDMITAQVQAIVLHHEALDEGFVGRSGYFYKIRAVVKGQLPSSLRSRLLAGESQVNIPADRVPPEPRRLEPRQYSLTVRVIPTDSTIKIMR